ncbi:MAG: TerC/Alx family metal homeostasis membrane protein [Ignavibacteriales bacterium]|nr:TerC/Alx family metal homeostasis membrane protein [Ignavibacteriales bacterium]
MDIHIFLWIIFIVIFSIVLYLDLYVTGQRNGKISLKSSLFWTAIWIITALLFSLIIFFFFEDGRTKTLEYLSGYIIEKSLSIDNLFVFIMIFKLMNIKDVQQPLVLKWGILSAIVLRITFIVAGVTLVHIFHPIIYVFGTILLYAAYKMAFGKETQINLETNPIIKFVSKRFNVITTYTGKKFFFRKEKKLFITSLFLTLILIESADIIFAVDSIPAVLAITTDPFIVITSNIFAILGLRALYFALAGVLDIFHHLKYGVAFILFFVGLKMIFSDYIHIDTLVSLIIILISLTASIFYSLWHNKFRKNTTKHKKTNPDK